MTHRLTTNCAKNYCNRTIIVKDIVENVVTCFFWDTVYRLSVVTFSSRAHRLATIHNVIDDYDSRTQHCSELSATVSTAGKKLQIG